MVPKRPGQLTRLSLSHVARGSVGSMFFQWRAARGGAEAFHPGMLPRGGPDARPFPEVVELGARLREIGRDDAPVRADVALVWDPESWWALQGPGLPAPDLDYWDAVADGARGRVAGRADRGRGRPRCAAGRVPPGSGAVPLRHLQRHGGRAAVLCGGRRARRW